MTTNPAAPEAKAQHYIPKLYLKGFTDKQGATVGPAFHYFLHFNGTNGNARTCDSQSSVTAGFLDVNGNLQSAPSASGTVSCSNTSPDGGYTTITNGTFSGTTSSGQPFTASFDIVNKNGKYGRYAQSAQWSLN